MPVLPTTLPSAVQLEPSVEYCQAPFAASAVWLLTAMPAKVFALEPPCTSSETSVNRPPKSEATVTPDGLVSSSIAASVIWLAVAPGASLTGVTVKLIDVDSAANGVVPPCDAGALRSTYRPSNWSVNWPVKLPSTAYTVRPGTGPLKSCAGRNCSQALAGSRNALLSDTAPISPKPPALTENHQVPWLAGLPPATAMPAKLDPSTSANLPAKMSEMRCVSCVPSAVVNAASSSVGASATGSTVIVPTA